MTRRCTVTAALLVLWACMTTSAVAQRPASTLTASFDPAARLGSSTAIHLGLAIDPRRAPSPVAELRLLYPASLGVTTSGLGLAVCRRVATDFQTVLIHGRGLAGCPRNAVMGYGTARAEVRFVGAATYPEIGRITVLSGPVTDGQLGLVAYVDGHHPFGAKLAYAGRVLSAPAPFGGALAIRLPAIPEIHGIATVALVELQLAIGSDDITYHERVNGKTIAYTPEGILLPDRCPRGGFRFSARLAFQDGSAARADAIAPCPAQRRR